MSSIWTPRRARGAESGEYVDAGRSNGPRNGALLSVSELNQVMGLEPALFRALKPLVTVHAWSTRVAPLSASTRVLRAVPGLSYSQVEQFVAERGELDNAGQAIRALSGGARYLARSQSAVFTLSAHARSASGVSAQRRAVVKINGNLNQPVSILAWYEDVNRDGDRVSAEQESGPAAAAAEQ
jgi:general secretion pathway protein K